MDTVLWVWSHQCGVEGRITSLDMLEVFFLMQLGIALILFAAKTHFWLMISLVTTRTPRTFSAGLLSSWGTLNMYLGLFLSIYRTFHLPLQRGVPISQFLQPVQVPQDGSTTAWHISYFSQYCVISELAEPHHPDH